MTNTVIDAELARKPSWIGRYPRQRYRRFKYPLRLFFDLTERIGIEIGPRAVPIPHTGCAYSDVMAGKGGGKPLCLWFGPLERVPPLPCSLLPPLCFLIF